MDPSPFLESLGIEPNEQQDAQEFNKLFISLLDSSLLAQGINIIDQQFGGTYCYRTKCRHCNSVSDRPSTFYELDLNIKGHSTLHKCLKDFLKDEVLDGDNQYFCCNCQCKRDATRKIVLQKLPKTLNLQLLRFVFDRSVLVSKYTSRTDLSNTKRRSSSCFQIYIKKLEIIFPLIAPVCKVEFEIGRSQS